MIKNQTFQISLIVLFITMPSLVTATLQTELVNLQQHLQALENNLKKLKQKKIPQIHGIIGSDVMMMKIPKLLHSVVYPINIQGFTEKIQQVIATANQIIDDTDESGRNELQKANGILNDAIKSLNGAFKISLKDLNIKIIEAIAYINTLSQEDKNSLNGKINSIYYIYKDDMIRILNEFYNYLEDVEKFGKNLKETEFARSSIPFVGDKEEYKKFKIDYKELYNNFEKLMKHIKDLNNEDEWNKNDRTKLLLDYIASQLVPENVNQNFQSIFD